MTPLEFIADVIGSLAWPAVLVLFLVFIRPHFSQILGLVRTVKFRQILTDVPEAKVEKIIASFKAEKATSVTARKRADGTHTVEAILPS